MCSNLLGAVLAARSLRGGCPPRGARSLDRLWAALSPFERAQLERDVATLTAHGVRATIGGGVEPLFYLGPLESCGPGVLAVLGPREARPEAVRLAGYAGAAAAVAGLTVLSGDTAGVEAAALRSALDRGGRAVSVLAEGFAPTPERPESGLVRVTPCAPGISWSIESAMARNATIAGLCTALVALDAAATGATLDAGMRALAAGRPVLALGATAGTRLLVDYGATAATDEIELMWWLQARTGSDLGTAARFPQAVDVVPAGSHRVAVGSGVRARDGSARAPEMPRPDGRASWRRPVRPLVHGVV